VPLLDRYRLAIHPPTVTGSGALQQVAQGPSASRAPLPGPDRSCSKFAEFNSEHLARRPQLLQEDWQGERPRSGSRGGCASRGVTEVQAAKTAVIEQEWRGAGVVRATPMVSGAGLSIGPAGIAELQAAPCSWGRIKQLRSPAGGEVRFTAKKKKKKKG